MEMNWDKMKVLHATSVKLVEINLIIYPQDWQDHNFTLAKKFCFKDSLPATIRSVPGRHWPALWRLLPLRALAMPQVDKPEMSWTWRKSNMFILRKSSLSFSQHLSHSRLFLPSRRLNWMSRLNSMTSSNRIRKLTYYRNSITVYLVIILLICVEILGGRPDM